MALSNPSFSRSRYQYEKLNLEKKEIRVIRILPGSSSDDLQCIMFHAPITEYSYQALSYAWHEPGLFSAQMVNETERLIVHEGKDYPESVLREGCSSIEFNDFQRMNPTPLQLMHFCLEIGVNLVSFLRTRRSPEITTELFWIDAICINQENTDERNAQVLRMADIYKSARLVMVWLGPPDKDSENAMSFIEELKEKFDDKEPCASCDLMESARCHVCAKNVISTCISAEGWAGLFRLFSRSWFSRTWIIQEVVLAQEVILLSGSTSSTYIPWERFAHFFATIVLLSDDWISRFLDDRGVDIDGDTFDRALSLAELRGIGVQKARNKKGLLKVLRYTMGSFCADPRDKIYGVLSLASDGEVIVPSPNYSLPVAEVYMDLTRSSMTTSGNLNHLYFAKPVSTALSLPSWCMDLSTAPETSPIGTYGSKSFSASKFSRVELKLGRETVHKLSAPLTYQLDTEIVTLTGFCVDVIDGLGAGLTGGSKSLIVQPDYYKTVYSSEKETWKAIWLALIAGVDREVFPKTPDDVFGHHFAARCYFYHSQSMENNNDVKSQPRGGDSTSDLRNWYFANKDFKIFEKTVSAWVTEYYEPGVHLDEHPPREQPSWNSFDSSFVRAIDGRRIVITERGYIGLVSNDVQKGDLLCILFGGKCPIILREVKDSQGVKSHYIVVGESYVHGLMFGEGMDDMDRGLYSIQDFDLR